MKKTSVVFGAICAISVLAIPAFAFQEESSKSTEQTSAEKLATLTKSITDLATTMEANRDKETDSVDTGGGDIEAALLSSFAYRAAAEKILEGLESDSSYLVMGADDQVSTDNWWIFQSGYSGLCYELTKLMDCGEQKKIDQNPLFFTQKTGEKDTKLADVLPVGGALVSLLSSLFRSETKISNLSGGIDSARLLAIAVQKGATDKNKDVRYLTVPRLTGEITATETFEKLNRLQNVRNLFASAKADKDGKLGEADAALLERVDGYLKSIISPDDKGKVALIDIVKAEKLSNYLERNFPAGTASGLTISDGESVEQINFSEDDVAKPIDDVAAIADAAPIEDEQDPTDGGREQSEPILDKALNKKIMIVKVEKAGGTMLKRKGIDVVFGAPSIRVSSGLIASYTIEGENGFVEKSSVVTCATKLTVLKNVHKLQPQKFTPVCH